MRKVLLKEIINSLETGSRPKGGIQEEVDGVFSLGGEHLTRAGGFDLSNKRLVPRDFYDRLKGGKISNNDILIVKDGATTGKVSFVSSESLPLKEACINEHVFALRANPEKVLPKFLFYFLFSPVGNIEILQDFRGAAIGGITRNFVSRVNVPLPDLQTQTQIVAALDKAKSLIDKRQESIELLEKLLRATFLIQFQQKFNKTDELIELGDVISDGPQNGIYKHSDHYGSGTRILRIDGFYDGVVTGIDGLKRVQLNEKEVKTYSLEKDDIVINRVNSREYLGKSAIIPELSEETVFESNMMRFKVNRERMLPKFLIYVLQQDFIKAQILKRAKDAINQSSINQQDVKSLKVPKCSIQEQELFQTLFEQTTLIRDKYLKGLLVMQELFQSLLQRAFHGDLSFDIDLQLDAFLSNEDFDAIANDDVFIQRLIDRFNQHNQQNGEASEEEKSFKFSSLEDYEKSKKILFNLMKVNKVGQVYDKEAKRTTIEML